MEESEYNLSAEAVEESLQEFDIDEGIELAFDTWQERINSHETTYKAHTQARIYLLCQEQD